LKKANTNLGPLKKQQHNLPFIYRIAAGFHCSRVYMITSIVRGYLSRLFSSQSFTTFLFWKLFHYLWLAGKKPR